VAGENTMKIPRIVRYNPKKFAFMAVVYLISCWAICQNPKSALSWYYHAMGLILGGILGFAAVIKFLDPLLEYIDAKMFSWLNSKGTPPGRNTLSGRNVMR
jgi:hypothetical protein